MKKNNYDIRIIFIIIILILSCTALIVTSFAYYIQFNESENLPAGILDFYFNSDILNEEAQSYTVSNYTPFEDIYIEINNYDDEFRFSKEDISYTVSAYITNNELQNEKVEDVVVYYDDANEKGEYIISKDEKSAYISLRIPSEYFYNNEVEIKIIARSIQPFNKTLSANFTVFTPFENTYISVGENNESKSAVVTISSYEFSGNVLLQYDNSIYPDRTNPYITKDEVSGKQDIFIGTGEEKSSAEIQIGSFSSVQINFFKDDTNKLISNQDFILINRES